MSFARPSYEEAPARGAAWERLRVGLSGPGGIIRGVTPGFDLSSTTLLVRCRHCGYTREVCAKSFLNHDGGRCRRCPRDAKIGTKGDRMAPLAAAGTLGHQPAGVRDLSGHFWPLLGPMGPRFGGGRSVASHKGGGGDACT